MIALLSHPWPWYVAGPIIGLFVPALLILGSKHFGVSSNFRHLCAAIMPRRIPFFLYDWRRSGLWNLAFLAGILVGGYIGGRLLAGPDVAISDQTRETLSGLGIQSFSGLVPADWFNWSNLPTLRGIILMILGGFLVGFGAAYAGGCTSGHAIYGLADRQLPSLIAVFGFFVGGLILTHLIMPVLF